MMGQRAAASAERIYEILDEQPTIVDRPGAVDLVDCRGDVAFDARGLRLRRRDGTVVLVRVRPASRARARRWPWSAGPGSGKSTVARLLTRFYDVTGGAVRIDGHDVRDLTLASLRAHVGVVLDEPFLFSVSIRDNIAYGRPDADLADIEAAARAAGADEFIRELPDGYDTVVGERGYTLSGGQRQRIAIARTLLVNPPILVLDDATSAIDVQVEQQIHDALRRSDAGPHHADHRPPAVDHQPGRPGGPARRRRGRGRRHPRRAAGHHPALRRGAGPGRRGGAPAPGRTGLGPGRRPRRSRRPPDRPLVLRRRRHRNGTGEL